MDKGIKLVGVNTIKFNRQFKFYSDCYEYLASIITYQPDGRVVSGSFICLSK